MLEVLSAALLLAQAPDCAIEVAAREGAVLMRPACPASHQRTRLAVQEILDKTTEGELRLSFGRIERYAWLSSLLAQQASSSRHWDPGAGKDNQYVATALRGMPEFTALFGRWHIAGISVEKVLVKPAAQLPLAQGVPVPPDAPLPYDAILWVTLKR